MTSFYRMCLIKDRNRLCQRNTDCFDIRFDLIDLMAFKFWKCTKWTKLTACMYCLLIFSARHLTETTLSILHTIHAYSMTFHPSYWVKWYYRVTWGFSVDFSKEYGPYYMGPIKWGFGVPTNGQKSMDNF